MSSVLAFCVSPVTTGLELACSIFWGGATSFLSSAFHIVAADAWRWACMARRFCITAPKPRNACHLARSAVPPWPRRASHATLVQVGCQVQRKQGPQQGVGHVLHKGPAPCCGDRGKWQSRCAGLWWRCPRGVPRPAVRSALCGLAGAGSPSLRLRDSRSSFHQNRLLPPAPCAGKAQQRRTGRNFSCLQVRWGLV